MKIYLWEFPPLDEHFPPADTPWALEYRRLIFPVVFFSFGREYNEWQIAEMWTQLATVYSSSTTLNFEENSKWTEIKKTTY